MPTTLMLNESHKNNFTVKTDDHDAKNAKARISMLCRSGAFDGVAGSAKDVCAVNLARFLSES